MRKIEVCFQGFGTLEAENRYDTSILQVYLKPAPKEKNLLAPFEDFHEITPRRE
jgi:hypothetical protein